ncbi:hypothetical protein [uncultured Flavobacterium sp.]|uniref:LIC11966 family surface protein n=1 Tax=uncultured Flavobacterium sp. TaxID=165435 RepID=UPI0030ED5FF4|tara:strand:+ start:131227 stop:132258 length:1032 start_codon:yes stop_codon:yes gene_type:complete
MKLKLILLALLIQFSTSAQEFNTPVDYLSHIGKEQDLIAKSTWKYTKTVAHSKSARWIDNTRKQLVTSIQNATKKISAIKDGYKGDQEYKNQILDYLSIVEKNINEEYSKIIDMQEVADQSYDLMEAYILTRDLVNEKLDAEQEKVINAQKSFALKYNVNLSNDTSELGKKMQKSNEVFKYKTELYLIFFKAYVTDSYLSNAIEKKDLPAIEQNKNALIQYADEGLEKIKAIKAYNNDSSVLNATKKALDYFKKEGEDYAPKITNFIMFNDKFENARKTLEAKKQKDRTKEEIDNYNAMVKQVNTEINNYNKENNSNFQEKNKAINNWNTVADNFVSKHVPVD